MKKAKIAAIVVIALIVIVAVGIGTSSPRKSNAVFHVTLADPSLYQDGVYSDTFDMVPGTYKFNFVPNGDSPEKLSITLGGPSMIWKEDYELEGTPNTTGISEYYTWDYIGEKNVEIFEEQAIQIIIDPHENFLGPVSVQILKTE